MTRVKPHRARLRAWRMHAGPHGTPLTLEAAAALLGAKHATWCEWEHGGRRPSLEYAIGLELLTGIPAESWNPAFGPAIAMICRFAAQRTVRAATGTED